MAVEFPPTKPLETYEMVALASITTRLPSLQSGAVFYHWESDDEGGKFCETSMSLVRCATLFPFRTNYAARIAMKKLVFR